MGFLSYAIEGFVDGIREAVDMVRAQQLEVAWVNYVHERFGPLPSTPASARQRSLVLAMPMGKAVPVAELDELTPKIARLYATTDPRVLPRDLNRLQKLGLISRVRSGCRANFHVVQALLPPMASGDN